MKEVFIFIRNFFFLFGLVYPVLFLLLFLLIVGAVLIAKVESLPFGAALYFILITGLTVGYGDIAPVTAVGRGISVIVALIGLMNFGIITAIATRALAESVLGRDLRQQYGKPPENTLAKLLAIFRFLFVVISTAGGSRPTLGRLLL